MTARFATAKWGLTCCAMFSSATCFAKATIVTLSELTKQSEVIVYGSMDQDVLSSASGTSAWVAFRPTLTLKGAPAIRDGAIELCNTRPNTEWPDLSKVTDSVVLFLSKAGDCFNLSHNYRSVVRVRNNRAHTGEIKGQLDDQPLDHLLERIRTLVFEQMQR